MSLKFMAASALAMAARSMPADVFVRDTSPLVAAAMSGMTMQAAPIEPSWVIDGTPQARLAEHSRSPDDAAITAVWDCTAGEFRWYFHWDETVVILEGEVHVTAEDGSMRVLKAGDLAYFAGKTWATWRVDEYVKKVAFVRKPFPAPLAIAFRLKNWLRPSGGSGLAA